MSTAQAPSAADRGSELTDGFGLGERLRRPSTAPNWATADRWMLEAADEIERLRRGHDAALRALQQQAPKDAKRLELEDLLFSLGTMRDAPCFCCGYNGPGYFQPKTHACAEKHHRLFKRA